MAERRLSAAALVRALEGWSGRGPAYQDVARSLSQAISGGRVPLAARLPGERELAAALGVSRTTVSAAYARLRDEGFVRTRPGARATTALPPGAAARHLPLPLGPAPSHLLDLAYATLPAPEAVAGAYAAALAALSAHLPTHGYAPLGLGALRELIAGRYSARGLPTSSEQVIVTNGAQSALSLLVGVLAGPGDRALVEQPTYPHALDALRRAGCRLVPVPLSAEGWDLPALRAAMRQSAPRLAYLIPDFHNPTGHCMTELEREALAQAALENAVTLVIDETLVELALDVPVPRPVAAFERRAEVVSIGSLSKSCWAGLRIGWLRAPRALAERVANARAATDLGAPLLEQLAAAALLADLEPTLAARRETLKKQRAALLGQLARQLPDWRYPLPAGGLSLWATLPSPVSSALAATAERFGVRVAAGARFGAQGLFERQLRLPFTLPEAELEQAVARLARAYGALREGNPAGARAGVAVM